MTICLTRINVNRVNLIWESFPCVKLRFFRRQWQDSVNWAPPSFHIKATPLTFPTKRGVYWKCLLIYGNSEAHLIQCRQPLCSCWNVIYDMLTHLFQMFVIKLIITMINDHLKTKITICLSVQLEHIYTTEIFQS